MSCVTGTLIDVGLSALDCEGVVERQREDQPSADQGPQHQRPPGKRSTICVSTKISGRGFNEKGHMRQDI